MNITESDLEAEIERFGHRRRQVIRRVLAGLETHVPHGLALAIGSRETNLANIVGDAGHGRGVFQQDDRFQRAFLARTPGCASGSYRATFADALGPGRVPTLAAGCRRMARIVDSNVALAVHFGIPRRPQLRFAVAAYNGGAGNALKGWHEFRDVDRFTTGHDYSEDVFARWSVIREIGL